MQLYYGLLCTFVQNDAGVGSGLFLFFFLPKDEAVKNQWLKFIFTAIPQQYSHNLVLCPRHFTEDCYSVSHRRKPETHCTTYLAVPDKILASWNNRGIKPSVDFHVGLNENANVIFATRCRFRSGKIAVSPVAAVHKSALRSQMLLYQALQAWWN